MNQSWWDFDVWFTANLIWHSLLSHLHIFTLTAANSHSTLYMLSLISLKLSPYLFQINLMVLLRWIVLYIDAVSPNSLQVSKCVNQNLHQARDLSAEYVQSWSKITPYFDTGIVNSLHIDSADVYSKRMTYLGASIDGVANIKSPWSVEQHSVQEITLSRSIHSCHWNYSNWTTQWFQKASALLINLKFYTRHVSLQTTICDCTYC